MSKENDPQAVTKKQPAPKKSRSLPFPCHSLMGPNPSRYPPVITLAMENDPCMDDLAEKIDCPVRKM